MLKRLHDWLQLKVDDPTAVLARWWIGEFRETQEENLPLYGTLADAALKKRSEDCSGRSKALSFGTTPAAGAKSTGYESDIKRRPLKFDRFRSFRVARPT